MDSPFSELREILELQRETVHLLHRILKHLHPEPVFTLHIGQETVWQYQYFYSARSTRPDTDRIDFYRRTDMAAITAGQSGSFFLTATASDNSTVSLASPTLTADDATVTIAPDTTDPSGLTFTVTVPASDTATTFNLSATAQATSNTSTAPQSVTATLAVTISPASVPVTFTLAINEK